MPPWLAALAGVGEGAAAAGTAAGAAGAAGAGAGAATAAAGAAAPAAAAAGAGAGAGAAGLAEAAAPAAAGAAEGLAANAPGLAAANAMAAPGAGTYGVMASDVAAPAQGLTGVTTPVPFDPALATNSAIQASGVPSPMGAPGATGLGSSGPMAATGMGGGGSSSVGAPGGGASSVWDKLGQLNKWMQKKGGALDDAMKPVGQVMNALDVLGVNKPPGKLPPIQSKLHLEQPPPMQQQDPDAQRLAILQAFNMQG